VFIVHGHDEGAKQAVARFLERLKLRPVILHEEADRGRTIIEKFQDHSVVGFAVILLTPDDEGRLLGGELKPRARQNVIMELGYFIGTLGRSRVCALKVGSVEEPSDLHGVLYVPFDEKGAWKLRLATELKACGIEVDMNLAI
jgi:predicted nucleotide-binding protein